MSNGPTKIITDIFPLLKCNNPLSHCLQKIFRIVVTSQRIYECNYYMAGKNNGKYHLWLWSSLVKIMDLSLVAFGHS